MERTVLNKRFFLHRLEYFPQQHLLSLVTLRSHDFKHFQTGNSANDIKGLQFTFSAQMLVCCYV